VHSEGWGRGPAEDFTQASGDAARTAEHRAHRHARDDHGPHARLEGRQ
jgi:hypothetical protein